jgi:hypothetical protein
MVYTGYILTLLTSFPGLLCLPKNETDKLKTTQSVVEGVNVFLFQSHCKGWRSGLVDGLAVIQLAQNPKVDISTQLVAQLFFDTFFRNERLQLRDIGPAKALYTNRY